MKRTRRSNFKTSKKIKLDKDQPLDDVKKTEERVQLKKLYAKLIAKDITEKPKLVGKCLAVIGDDLQGAVRRHDTCRVVQMCLKHGSAEQQTVILGEMVGIFRELACNKYSIHLAAKVFKLSEDKEALAFSLIPDARRIVTQKEGSKFIQVLYDTKYRTPLMKSLFGGADATVESAHLRDFLDADGATLSAVGRIVNKCLAKELQNLNVVQVIILEYLECLQDKSTKLELLARLQESLLTLMDNRAGVRIAILALSASDNKARKAVLKTVKGHLGQLCQGEYSFLFVIKLLSIIDDTKRVGNLVSSDICQDLESITSVNQGVKVLNTLLFAAWKTTLSMSEWELLEEDLNQVSKKDANQRRTEVLMYVLPRLANITKERIRDFIVDPHRNRLVLGVAENVILGVWKDPLFVEELANLVKIVDIAGDPVGQRVLKKVVETEASHASSQFSEKMVEVLARTSKDKVLKSRGVWILVALAEKSVVKSQVKDLFSSEDLAGLEGGQKGEKALFAVLST